ncbi:hypothetical protein BDZ97DRAFT_193506 [Flammula alnicola]|nr:hypothetical protein BDZ97DRAFT_193506 [Flammula alnicola]
MPVCPQCDNRQFSNKEALLQHMRSSSAWHPFCSSCDRRFVSQTAYEAHMAAKHPPTFDCTVCNRPYHAPFALEDHYRGSSAHPNCTKCGRGFRDQPACEEHRRTAHPTSSCAPCGGRVFYNDELDQHYLDSINHPSCTSCTRGFKDDTAYVEHMSTAHPEQHCGTCNANFETPEALQAHFWSSPAHPKCDQCNVGFQNSEGRQFHLETVHTPTVTAAPTTDPTVITLNTIEEVKLDEIQAPPHPPPPPAQEPENLYSTGFTPLSPRHPMQRLIVGERRIDSPDLRLDLGFSSPITDVKPLFSPTVLPRPGGKIEELWSSTENVQVAPARVNHFTPSVPGILTRTHGQHITLTQATAARLRAGWTVHGPSGDHGRVATYHLHGFSSPFRVPPAPIPRKRPCCVNEPTRASLRIELWARGQAAGRLSEQQQPSLAW